MEEPHVLVEQISRLTELEGFVGFCRDIRDSMTFYDRDVLLAIASGILQGMMITALYTSGMQSNAAFLRTTANLAYILEHLPQRLAYHGAALDIQALVERFLEVGGQSLREEFPALASAFDHYFRDAYDLQANLNELLMVARQVRPTDEKAALNLVGQVGALVLRGRRIRPVWLEMAGPLEAWLLALTAMVDTISTLPYLRFPLGPAAEERQRLARGSEGERVVHLADVRRLRQGRAAQAEEDPVDEALGELLADREELSAEAVKILLSRAEEVEPILITMATAEEFREGEKGEGYPSVHAVRLLVEMGTRRAVEPLLQVVAQSDPSERVFHEARQGLVALGARARGRILSFANREADLETAVYLAEVLARGRRDERVFQFLTNLFRQTTWWNGKEMVVGSLAEYGDVRALPLLEQALAESSSLDAVQEEVLRSAIGRLQAKALRQETKGRRRGREQVQGKGT